MSAHAKGSNYQRPYPPEFWREAVARVRTSGRPIEEITRELGVSRESLRLFITTLVFRAGGERGNRLGSYASPRG